MNLSDREIRIYGRKAVVRVGKYYFIAECQTPLHAICSEFWDIYVSNDSNTSKIYYSEGVVNDRRNLKHIGSIVDGKSPTVDILRMCRGYAHEMEDR
jgi:hypothetical protein